MRLAIIIKKTGKMDFCSTTLLTVILTSYLYNSGRGRCGAKALRDHVHIFFLVRDIKRTLILIESVELVALKLLDQCKVQPILSKVVLM